uniref:Uncharacterized protein n=1 Tax=Cacopsylla melanoneura TaxID=428564 RepID=A0A8D9EZH0_9HEMI
MEIVAIAREIVCVAREIVSVAREIISVARKAITVSIVTIVVASIIIIVYKNFRIMLRPLPPLLTTSSCKTDLARSCPANPYLSLTRTCLATGLADLSISIGFIFRIEHIPLVFQHIQTACQPFVR